MRAARAPSGAWTLRLATREHTKQESQARGDGDGLQRIAPDGLLGFISGFNGLILGAVHLTFGDAGHGAGEVLQVGADRIDLIGEIVRVAGAGPGALGARANIAIGGVHGGVLTWHIEW